MSLAALELPQAARERVRISVRGAVQGVGFRPFVHRQALALGLAGWVANAPDGVNLEVEGQPAAVAAMLRAIRQEAPTNATVSGVDVEVIVPTGERSFAIRQSVTTGARGGEVLPDLAACEACLAEMRDPSNRRYRYPFTNCTQCGPRYSIIDDLPYDRERTSMRGFPMCRSCREEYEDAGDRRFHAEPIACPACGPQLALWNADGAVLSVRDDALLAAAERLSGGEIVAVKGLGGFHLMVNARDGAAVARLRRLKQREEKPFAVMFASLAAVQEEAVVGPQEAALLGGPECPIVLLRRRDGSLAAAVAPGNPRLGALLPYTPLHHLLLKDLAFPVVATSGNRSEEPIATNENEALVRLGGIADVFLVHDRPIVRPVDDSVVQMVAGRPQVIRRARGHAPAPIGVALPTGILALGGHLKAAIALTTNSGIVLGQHIGNLDGPEAREAYDHAVSDIARLQGTHPRLVARDTHPDYYSTRVAPLQAKPTIAVQHHAAHVAACMAEHGLSPPVLGVAWDGTGHGDDGTIWGGEFLVVTDAGWERVAHLRPFHLPGGDAAVREPRRSAIGLLYAVLGATALDRVDLAPVADFAAPERGTLAAMLGRGLNSPATTSAGRLFDAVASLTGIRQRSTYEGQAAADLEWTAADKTSRRAYPFAVREVADAPTLIDWEPALWAILADVGAGAATAEISAAFHNGLVAAIADVAKRIGIETIVLSGGCFQNRRLTEAAIDALNAAGKTAWWHQRIPPNDGGLAVGQAWWAAHAGGVP